MKKGLRALYLAVIAVIAIIVIAAGSYHHIVKKHIPKWADEEIGNLISEAKEEAGEDMENDSSSTATWQDEKTIADAQISRLDINLGASDIRIVPGKTYTVSYKTNVEAFVPDIRVEDDTLKVTNSGNAWEDIKDNFWKDPLRYIRGWNSRVTITVPEGTTLAGADLHCGAGDISIGKIAADKWDIECSAGDAEFSETGFGDLELNVSAGDLDVVGGTFEKIEGKVSAGDVRISQLEGLKDASYDIRCSAGDLNIDGVGIDGNGHITQEGSNGKKVELKCSAGDMTIDW